MFGKLMKYELRYLLRIFIPLWVMLLGLCGLARLGMWGLFDSTSAAMEVAAVLLIMAVYMAFLAVIIITEVVVVVRFYKGMYGDEGYLMFTLPVTNGHLLHAKGLSATLVTLVTVVVGLLSGLILLSFKEVWMGIDIAFAEFSNIFSMTTLQSVLLGFWLVVAVLISIIGNIYGIYLAISIGQMWRKHPIIGAILTYYGMSILMSGIMQAVLVPLTMYGETFFMDILTRYEPITIVIGMLVIVCVFSIVLTAIFALITKYLMDKRLNIA